ncbi:peptidoglycan-binding domain-containing protein [Compostimonas suwonensis]|uniref:Putative peptidoglycan binding protein n=1 Tax=Compostimonas suwonensis TaxID=1048394 RepID=A0A2M9C000_9MICO|nr:peptidoglycan-binding protein [Compostimonas suwonensis]PJJ63665.1 putative peptidoglycan binding protein [Compostimonas suwonensis]
MSKRRSLATIGLAVIGVVTVAACGAAIVAVAVAPTMPGTLQPSRSAESVEVTEQEFVDERTVDVELVRDPGISLSVPLTGRITRFGCRPGASIASGGSFVSVDGRPLLTLATSMPLWRDLSIGDEGDDVKALQTELARLGYAVTADGDFGSASLAAVKALFTSIGDAAFDEPGLPVSRVMWAPTTTTVISTCIGSLGSSVSSGDALGTVQGIVSSAGITNLPSDLLSGARVLEVDGQVTSVNDDGTVTDPGALDLLSGMRGTTGAARDDGDGGAEQEPNQLAATFVLQTPVLVAALPPSSIYGVEGSEGCVRGDAVGVPVRIVGSQLGQSFVLFEGHVPKRVDVVPTGVPACR